MTTDSDIAGLRERLVACEMENMRLKEELAFLKDFPAVAHGLKAERLVAKLAGGVVTGHKVPYDVEVGNGDRLEVKYSRLGKPYPRAKTKRWTWIRLLGQNDTKQFEWLVLVGEKDPRYESQYPAGLPYVFFLVPRSEIGSIRTAGKMSVALNTNLATAKAAQSVALKRHFVRSEATFKNLLANCGAA